MKSIAILLSAIFLFGTQSSYAENPDPKAILEGARMATALTHLDEGLNGHLSHNGNKTPIHIFLKGKDIQFKFFENNQWRGFHLQLNDDQFDLFEIVDNKAKKFPNDKLTQSIAGTDITYEDLAFRFLYWPNPKYEGKEKIGNEETHKLRLTKPAGAAGNYYAVYLWVHVKFGAFMKITGHSKTGELLKEFQVEDVMKVADNLWTLRKMKVSSYKDGRRTSFTDMILEKPSAKAVRGLR